MPEAIERRQCPRLPLSADVDFRRRKQTHYVIGMHDLTTHGCRISSPERLDSGERVWVQLPSLQSLCANVKWTNSWQSGVEFERPLHPAVFNMMAARLVPANDS